jgi:hypothetical protein
VFVLSSDQDRSEDKPVVLDAKVIVELWLAESGSGSSGAASSSSLHNQTPYTTSCLRFRR